MTNGNILLVAICKVKGLHLESSATMDKAFAEDFTSGFLML